MIEISINKPSILNDKHLCLLWNLCILTINIDEKCYFYTIHVVRCPDAAVNQMAL